MSILQPIDSGSVDEALNTLSNFNFFSKKDAEVLLPYLELNEIASGETLWREGDKHTFVTFILAGRFEENKATEFANKPIVVAVYGKGSMIGESSLLDNLPCPLTAVCFEDAKILSLSHDSFATLQQENPQTAIQVLKGATMTLAIRLRKSYDRLAAIF